MSIFGFGAAPPGPDQLVRRWKSELKKEERVLDRSVRDIEREEAKLKASIKEMAKRSGDDSSSNAAAIRLLARALVSSRKEKSRLIESKTRLQSVSMQLRMQLAQIRVTHAMQASTQAMATMNHLVSIPQIAETMFALGREMEKAGFIQEFVSEAIDDVLDGEQQYDDEEAVDAVMQGILEELTPRPAAAAARVPSDAEIAETPSFTPAAPVVVAQPAQEETEELNTRMQALTS